MTINWPSFIADIRAAKNVLITSHVRPDADALGSELGMALVLEVLGKQVRIVNGDATPPNLAFLDAQQRIKQLGRDLQLGDFSGVDLLMILDTSAWAQLGPMSDVIKSLACKKIVLDHHVGEDDLGVTWYKNTSAEAAGRLVAEAAEQLGVRLTAEMAMPLFAALATDTGWFRFGSATNYTYELAARLIDAGARPAEIYKQLYEQDTLGRVRLRGEILSRITLELDGRLAHTHVLKEDFGRLGARPSDTEDVINQALGIKGTQFAVIFVEQAQGGFKLSFRSRCQVDCNKLAQRFGGGGHKAAAGAFVQGTLDEVRDRVLTVVREAVAAC
jgi:phosphoesterase RecJ-like protein